MSRLDSNFYRDLTLVINYMDSRVQDERHWSCEGTTASVNEDYVVLEVLLVEREGFRVLSSTRDLYGYENCPFCTLARVL